MTTKLDCHWLLEKLSSTHCRLRGVENTLRLRSRGRVRVPVFEMVENHRGGAYRAIYTVRFAEAIYVLHVFEKKSKRGIKTPQLDIEKVSSRLRMAREHYAQTFEK